MAFFTDLSLVIGSRYHVSINYVYYREMYVFDYIYFVILSVDLGFSYTWN